MVAAARRVGSGAYAELVDTAVSTKNGLSAVDLTLSFDRGDHVCRAIVDEPRLLVDDGAVDDALVALEQLRTVDGVDADRIVVVGHGLGGTATPRIAARDGDLAGVVGLAAPARPYHELTLEQLEHKVSVGDHEWDGLARIYERWSDEIERVREGEYESGDTLLGKPGAFWDSLAAYDHLGVAVDVDVPLYLLQRERDFQVTAADDLERWRSELDGKPNAAFETYEELDHLFMPGEGPSVEFAYAVRNNVAEGVVADLADWIAEL